MVNGEWVAARVKERSAAAAGGVAVAEACLERQQNPPTSQSALRFGPRAPPLAVRGVARSEEASDAGLRSRDLVVDLSWIDGETDLTANGDDVCVPGHAGWAVVSRE